MRGAPSGATGALCGYAGVLPGHPLYGTAAFQTALEWALEAHGGVNYAGDHSFLREHGAWWFGFDCGHFNDLAPALNALLRDLRSPRHWPRYAANGTPPPPDVPRCLLGGHYWTVEEVRAEAEALAVQLVAAGNAAVHGVLEDIAAGVRSTEDEAQ